MIKKVTFFDEYNRYPDRTFYVLAARAATANIDKFLDYLLEDLTYDIYETLREPQDFDIFASNFHLEVLPSPQQRNYTKIRATIFKDIFLLD